MAHKNFKVESTLTQLNDVSDTITIKGLFDISIVGTGFTGSVTFQRSFDGGSTWNDVTTWTDDVEDTGEVGSGQIGRFKVTAYTAGSVAVGIYSGR